MLLVYLHAALRNQSRIPPTAGAALAFQNGQ